MDVGRWMSANRFKLNTDRTVRRQFGVLLLATTASTSSPITRWWIGSHTGSCLCYVQGRLLQSADGRSTKVCYRQVAAGHDRCSASCQRHVRSTTAAWLTYFTLIYIGSMWQIKSHTSYFGDVARYKFTLILTNFKNALKLTKFWLILEDVLRHNTIFTFRPKHHKSATSINHLLPVFFW